MRHRNLNARINVKLLVILILVTAAVGISLVAARQIRRSILSKMSLETGEAAFAKRDWPAAYKNLQEYLGRNPDDVEVLKKYAKARLSVRPLEPANIAGVISAYRRVLQLVPLDDVAYDQLAILYPFVDDFESLAYIARMRIERTPKDPSDRKTANDWKAPLWLADALVQLNKAEEARQTLEKLERELKLLSDKHIEYVKACALMCQLVTPSSAVDAQAKALTWLDKAVAYDPNSAALANRARFFLQAKNIPDVNESDRMRIAQQELDRRAQNIPDMNESRRMRFARQDLEAADRLGTNDPQIRYLLGQEWLALQELERATAYEKLALQALDRAAAELQAIDKLPKEAIEKSFFDMDSWKVARFLLASDLALRRNATTEALALADDTLAALTEKRHRIKVLPSAISIYLTAQEGAKTDTERTEVVRKAARKAARKCLDEYLDLVRGQQAPAASPLALAWLEASVEVAENRPYAVIDTLQPVAVSTSANFDMWRIWRLLGEAYSRTNQTARAANALQECLQVSQRLGVSTRHPQMVQVLRDLAKQYALMVDWKKTFETVQMAESAGATDLATKLSRIEAGVHLAVTTEGKVDAAKLTALSAELDGLRQTQPKEVNIRVLQAGIAAVLKQPQEVETQLKLAIAECNEPLRAERELAGFYFRAQRRPEAISLCKAACQRHPGVAEPWLILSEIQVADANDQAARQSLQQGLEAMTDPREKRSLSRRLAWLDLAQGDHAAGIRLLRDLAAQDANDLQVRSLLLETREIQSDPDAVAGLIGELQKAEGQNGVRWRLYQASSWLSSNDWRSKQRDIAGLLQYCINADPRWSAPVVLLATLYDRLGDTKQMEDLCRQALLQNPAAVDIAEKLLALLYRQGKSREAEAVLQQVRMDPQRANAWQVNLALRAGDFSKAIGELRDRVSGDAPDAEARIILAQLVYRQTKDSRQALQYLKEAEALTSDSQMQARAMAAKASILRAEGQTEEARRVLDDYVAKHNDFDAFRVRAEYLAVHAEWEGAEQDYRKLTTFADRSGTGHLLLGEFYVSRNDFDKAVAALDEGLKAHPEDSSLERGRLRLFLARAPGQGRERGMEILASLEKRLPQDPELMWLRAGLLLESPTPDSIRQARTILENVVKLAPTAVDAHLTLINLALQAREYRAARDYALRALVSNSNSRALRLAQARAELELQNYPTASDLAHRVLQEDPNSTEAIDVLLDTGRRSNNGALLGEARTGIDAAVRRDPANERLLLTRARVLATLQPPEVDELRTVISTCLSAKTQDAAMLLRTASVVASSSSTELKKEGVRLFERAANLSPASAEARLGLASALFQTGNTERAEKIYREELAQHPDSIRALNDLAWILQEHGQRFDEALKLADKALTLAPNDLNLLDTRGTILAKLPERLTDAKSDFARLVELSPSDSPRMAKALLQLGRVCFELKDLSQAKETLEKALQIDQKLHIFKEAERTEIAEITSKTEI